MKKFKNYSISKKLITGFLTVTLIMLLVGAVGLLGMARIDAMDTYMYQVKTAPMNDLILAIENLYQIKSDSRDMVIQTGDSQKLSELEKNYKTQKEEFLNHAAAYKIH
ncbi:MCP four helix bundle domain-containing protein [Lacrimispora xylanisolvens]|uniref:MCP four helix bundle domain-containing protein n=1 Tax=Lacrimispora xylanisolvens TaxID=384636 RepID=UPI002402798F